MLYWDISLHSGSTQQGGTIVDLRELEYFVAIAHQQNITHAAQKLYVSQPTLTKFLQRLEQRVGLALFERKGGSMELTYAGERYLAWAVDMLQRKEELDSELAAIRQDKAGKLRVGIPSVRCSVAMPKVVPAFSKLYPQVELSIVEQDSQQLEQALVQGELDLNFYNLSKYCLLLEYQILGAEPVYAVVACTQQLESGQRDENGCPVVSLGQLAHLPFLLQKPSQRQGEYLYNLMAMQGVSPRKILETSNIRAAVSMAAGGYGVAFISRSFLDYLKELGPFDAYRLKDAGQMQYVAAWRKGEALPQYAKEFIRLMACI